MSKVRVYEVARELGLANRELIQRIAALGIQVRNHMSVLDTAEVERVKRALEKARAADTVEERIRPTVVRRRVKKKKQPEAEAPAAEKRAAAAAPEPAVAEPVAEPVRRKPKPKPEPEPVEVKPEAAPEPPPEPEPVRAAPEPAPEPPRAPEPEVVEEPRVQEPTAEPPAAAASERPATEPPPAEERFKDPPMPIGVIKRGNTVAPPPGTGQRKQLSDEERQRIVAEHAASRPTPRRRMIGRSAIGPSGRPQGRPGKRRMQPGRKPKQTEITVPSAAKRVIRIEGEVQLQTLAQRMRTRATDVLMKLMQMGVSGVHINSTLDADTASILAEEFGYQVENVAQTSEEIVDDARGDFENVEADQELRAPVVTIMGHVDHGKTSLLDKIRATNVAAGEAGGITQHISSFRVDTKKGPVVFLDTPGHQAFTEMRARGAQVTDVVILVTAADDGVMPQTREALDHSKAAGVPIVVAVNKIDKPDAQPDKVMNELASLGLTPEEWGGEAMFISTSAHTGEGIDKLLESVLLQAEVLELKSNPNIPAEGVVLEATLDRGRGVVANVLIKDGTLSTGDYVVAGGSWGRVRALTDDRGRKLKAAGPATPVELLGLDSMPAAGDKLYKVTNARKAQDVAESNAKGASRPATAKRIGLDKLQELMSTGEHHTLELVVKADVQGSIEALKSSLTELSTETVEVKIIHDGVGGITENDVMLASASGAIVLGFNVRPQGKASSMAKKSGVEVRTYNVIYEALDDVKAAMAGLLSPKLVEKELGKADVRQTFTVPKVGTVAGCMITDGKVVRSARCRLVRDGIVVWEGKLSSLRRFKDDVKEVATGFECGIGLENYNDVKVGDTIECFEHEEVAAVLE